MFCVSAVAVDSLAEAGQLRVGGNEPRDRKHRLDQTSSRCRHRVDKVESAELGQLVRLRVLPHRHPDAARAILIERSSSTSVPRVQLITRPSSRNVQLSTISYQVELVRVRSSPFKFIPGSSSNVQLG